MNRMREKKVWKTFMSIEPPPQQAEKVREDLNNYRHPGTDCFWRSGTIILPILAILLQTKKSAAHIKVLSDLVLSFLLMSIDIKVFQTFSPHSRAAPILFILLILLQTAERSRGTGPRTTAATNTQLQVQRT